MESSCSILSLTPRTNSVATRMAFLIACAFELPCRSPSRLVHRAEARRVFRVINLLSKALVGFRTAHIPPANSACSARHLEQSHDVLRDTLANFSAMFPINPSQTITSRLRQRFPAFDVSTKFSVDCFSGCAPHASVRCLHFFFANGEQRHLRRRVPKSPGSRFLPSQQTAQMRRFESTSLRIQQHGRPARAVGNGAARPAGHRRQGSQAKTSNAITAPVFPH